MKMIIRPAQIKWINEHTPYSLDFNDIYFSMTNGVLESQYVFLDSQNIDNRFRELSKQASEFKKHFSVFEFGFGSGLNFLLTLKAFLPYSNDFKLIYTSCEAYPLLLEDIKKIWKALNLESKWTCELEKKYPPCYPGVHPISFKSISCELHLFFMPIDQALDEFIGEVNAWFLDGFSPDKNKKMWDENVLKKMSHFSKKDETTCATFSSAGWVRRGLENAGFYVEKKKRISK